ncbi:low molecular weight protein-tyrosine-phosphatase [Novosphingobium sp. MBES04]|uniref:low molecular weight protein-tyrosine-phosphatase n=1 Tax=Novosphingobium sp. MBES04 TaxID=1206458 RepID=UPI00072361BD|nr:low molecular weight protein-tyrosine-phosphatase [Novosphingobium sp. MBES04]GAM07329.1 low molecular weight phosphotyrosine protein phosphatase [Novosphingobium sp. MBES04]
MMTSSSRPAPAASVLFVCLGNICRSPLAEAALREAATKAGLALEIDSAGTGSWHIGKAPDPRSRAEARRHGIDIGHYRARQVSPADFARFDRIIAMDAQNLADLEALAPADAHGQLSLLLDHVPGREGEDVEDPYFGGEEGFAITWDQVRRAADTLVRELAGQD